MKELILLPKFRDYHKSLILYLIEKIIPYFYSDEKNFQKFQGALELLRSVIIFPSTVSSKYDKREMAKLLKEVEGRVILRGLMTSEKGG